MLDQDLISTLRRFLHYGPLFLVGGSVRDLLLDGVIRDYDFLLEGDVFALGRELGALWQGEVITNSEFLTVSIVADHFTVDIARARKEVYEKPATLPKVSLASWQEDLARRDFTINAMALPVRERGWGPLIDPFGGERDLRQKIIRYLHKGSFRDDPTRILRAVRFKNRLGFTIEEDTLASLQKDWPYLTQVSPARRFHEWKLLCEEKRISACLNDIYELGGWPFLFINVSFQRENTEEIGVFLDFPNTRKIRLWFIYLLFLLKTQPDKLPALSNYWGISKRDEQELAHTLSVLTLVKTGPGLPKRKIYHALRDLPPEGLYFCYYHLREQAGSWQEFYEKVQAAELPLTGKDLIRAGCKEGPEIGRLLNSLQDAYFHGKFTTREEGLAYLRHYLERGK
ncbi:MAG: Polynucleotide adenylyltransferase region [Peptococcaceae bacterium]|jgi:tRNA nucleotidyltransferase (CCA-adding enzyme)|nr:Polynucleotide adenylyltransferase region [Peptococcaceae bacterium]